MERKGYEPDSQLVELLDNAYWLHHKAHEKAIREWVKGWNIKVPWSPEQNVRIKHKGQLISGVVAEIQSDKATCTVRCPQLGHVRDGEGSHGFIINSEDILAPDVAVASALSGDSDRTE